MNQINAKIVADSQNSFGQRLTTFVVTFPRIVLAEFNTHRMFSRNSASSRAIPFKKMLKSVIENPFIPIAFMKDHSGMQGNEYFTGWRLFLIKNLWLLSRYFAVACAWTLSKLGLTKQICNRILEPYMYHTVIVTASEWGNFFALRAEGAAEIHIQKLAYLMLQEYNNSNPIQLKAGEWHIPFGDKIDMNELFKKIEADHGVYDSVIHHDSKKYIDLINQYKIKIAVARAARVSYTVVGEEGKADNYENDIKLHDRLTKMGHWSPTEHAARAMTEEEFYTYFRGKAIETEEEHPYNHLIIGDTKEDLNSYGWVGNFQGYIQYRKLFSEENKTDSRIISK